MSTGLLSSSKQQNSSSSSVSQENHCTKANHSRRKSSSTITVEESSSHDGDPSDSEQSTRSSSSSSSSDFTAYYAASRKSPRTHKDITTKIIINRREALSDWKKTTATTPTRPSLDRQRSVSRWEACSSSSRELLATSHFRSSSNRLWTSSGDLRVQSRWEASCLSPSNSSSQSPTRDLLLLRTNNRCIEECLGSPAKQKIGSSRLSSPGDVDDERLVAKSTRQLLLAASSTQYLNKPVRQHSNVSMKLIQDALVALNDPSERSSSRMLQDDVEELELGESPSTTTTNTSTHTREQQHKSLVQVPLLQAEKSRWDASSSSQLNCSLDASEDWVLPNNSSNHHHAASTSCCSCHMDSSKTMPLCPPPPPFSPTSKTRNRNTTIHVIADNLFRNQTKDDEWEQDTRPTLVPDPRWEQSTNTHSETTTTTMNNNNKTLCNNNSNTTTTKSQGPRKRLGSRDMPVVPPSPPFSPTSSSGIQGSPFTRRGENDEYYEEIHRIEDPPPPPPPQASTSSITRTPPPYGSNEFRLLSPLGRSSRGSSTNNCNGRHFAFLNGTLSKTPRTSPAISGLSRKTLSNNSRSAGRKR